MGKKDKIIKILEKYYLEPKVNTKLQAAMRHNLTCGDLSHMHGVIKVQWDTERNDLLATDSANTGSTSNASSDPKTVIDKETK